MCDEASKSLKSKGSTCVGRGKLPVRHAFCLAACSHLAAVTCMAKVGFAKNENDITDKLYEQRTLATTESVSVQRNAVEHELGFDLKVAELLLFKQIL